MLKKLKQLLRKYPLRYGDLLRLAVGRFTLSSDLPPYVEEFMAWVMSYRYRLAKRPRPVGIVLLTQAPRACA